MPLYEYVCRPCGRKFEKLVRAWGDAVACPHCQGAEVEKQLSTFAMAFADGGASDSAAFGEGGGGCRATGGRCGCGAGGCGCA
jgi:putative FmdB family regulatory protein